MHFFFFLFTLVAFASLAHAQTPTELGTGIITFPGNQARIQIPRDIRVGYLTNPQQNVTFVAPAELCGVTDKFELNLGATTERQVTFEGFATLYGMPAPTKIPVLDMTGQPVRVSLGYECFLDGKWSLKATTEPQRVK